MSVGAGDPIVGRVLSGTYRVEARLGAGGMGAVYAARHVRTGKAYAVKVLLPELAARTSALDRFRREAHALAALGHAHIVAIHDFDQTPEGIAFLVMDRLEGEDLAARLRRGPLAHDVALSIADQIASGLEAAHGIGLVHRDLKPANVFLARVAGVGERAVLLDFGLAKSLAEDPVGAITSTGVVMGTPHYMSPEQAQGAALDARTDLWSLGVILHEMLSGRPPFEGATMASLFVQILTHPTPSLRARGVVVGDALESLLQRALAKSPSERFPDATSFRRALHAVGSGAHVLVPPTLAATPATRATPQGITPMGNAFATTGTGREPSSAPTSRAWWVALAALVTLGVIGTGATIAVALIATSMRASETRASEPLASAPAPAPVIDAGTIADHDAGVIATADEPDAGAPIEVATTTRTRARSTRRAAPEPTHDEPASSGNPVPPGLDTSAPGAAERVAARPFISSGDWAGCVRALRGAPPTREVLWDRASCSFQARDRAELERACAALDQRFAGSPQARGCQGLLSAMAYQ
ncbi:serine/threonine-protein kinase [Sandaracinus amylolyticus]|uniref:Serine/threonine protein kinase n=1 Tax=Sandaracinus amylolyticus TaxID=927083 RepID=A0A0F6W3N7_9BACT|nr:serine/threonine-protein kinase [Sandaracinus amylolyticus]AKF06586.1 serine/threonine protein kinase [Sandaracinus amylolyticus]